jgi:topoisomerase-4 subunit B
LRVSLKNGNAGPNLADTSQLVESLMGRKPELRMAFIQEHARFVEAIDI